MVEQTPEKAAEARKAERKKLIAQRKEIFLSKVNTLKDKKKRPQTEDGDTPYDADERVKMLIKYPSDWDRPKHLKDGSEVTVHPITALNYIENGFAEISEVVVPFKIKEKEK